MSASPRAATSASRAPIGQREIAEALGVSRETISLRLNEWERAGLLNTGGQSQRFEILDYPRVALRASVRKNDAPAAIEAALDEIDDDLDRGDLVRARNVALDMLTFFPASPDLRHRVALAAMRAGAVREAVDVLAQSGYATGGDIDLLGERVRLGLAHPAIAPARLFFGDSEPRRCCRPDDDAEARLPTLVEDIAAIEARARKEMAFATERGWQPAEIRRDLRAPLRDRLCRHRRHLCRHQCRDDGRRRRRAESARRRSPARFWPSSASRARATGQTPRSARPICCSARRRRRSPPSPPRPGEADASDGRLSSTRLQLRRIGAHAAVPVDKILARLPVGGVAVYCGRPFRDLDSEAQAHLEETLRPEIAAALTAEGTATVYGSLAAGADILFAEAALAAGCELNVVLPFPVESFVDVRGGPPAMRQAATTAGASASAPASTARPRSPPPSITRRRSAPSAAHLYHGFRLAAGLALLHADTLTADAVMLAASDGGPASNRTGIAAAMREWTAGRAEARRHPDGVAGGGRRRRRGRRCSRRSSSCGRSSPPPISPRSARRPPPRPACRSTCRRAPRATGAPAPPCGLPTSRTALEVLAALARLCRETAAPVSIVADFGPVLDARGAAERDGDCRACRAPPT